MPLSKAEIRREIRQRLRAIAPRRMEHSRAICHAISTHPAYGTAKIVALFDPLPAEPHVELLWDLAPRRFLYPRVVETGLALVEVRDLSDLREVAGFGFREPLLEPARIFPAAAVDLILVPGVAFTRDGARMGRGGGYYDRLLASLVPGTTRIGVCFESQIVEELPTEPHDMPVDFVITEAATSDPPASQP